MRKKIYISIIILFSLITVTTAFIPRDKKAPNVNQQNNVATSDMAHPESGYIEAIGD